MITIDGIEVVVVYKRVRKVTLKVNTNAQVQVVCNKRVSREYLISFVSKHIDWIRKTLEKKQSAPKKSLNLLQGDTITIFGKDYILNIISSDKDEIELENGEIKFYLKDKNIEKRHIIYKKWATKTLRQVIIESINKWKEITYLTYSSFVIKNMKSRWGSCNVKTKKIAFSLNLLSQDKDCIDYVVLHELTHTICVYHDAKFYEQIARFLPEYKAISKKLTMPTER